jgi:hypothetical protein
VILFCRLNRAYLPPDKKVEEFMESQESDLFAFINMSSKTHQALFIRRLSGSGLKVQGLAMPTFQFKRSYKEFSNTYEFSQ